MINCKIVTLSLKDALQRREKFKSNFSKYSALNFNFFDGIYGKDLKKNELDKIYNPLLANKKINRELTKGEIGATYSHFLIYKQALDEKVDYLIVLEDDSYINKDFDMVTKELISEINPEESSIIFIQQHTLNNKVILSKQPRMKINNEYSLYKLLGSSQYFVGSYGYIVTKKALTQLVESYLPIFCVCDHWFFIKKRCNINNFFVLKKHLVSTNEEEVRKIDSFINNERSMLIKYKPISVIAKLKIKIKYYFLRAINKDWE
ncbi:glycosyltransferase family 25 protein [Proteus terrae]|uniref:glycosyltransferase family 25 protein n=1 Tax=Proteus terrae TaxID=1574161 RepID=UPI0032DA480B